MDVTSAAALNGLYKTTNNQSSVRQANQTSATDGSFDTILSNAMKMVDDTNSLQNNASAEAVSFGRIGQCARSFDRRAEGESGTAIYSCGP